MELVHKYRPKKLEDVIGQTEAVTTLQGLVSNGSLPKAFLFSGPLGVGKTTLARILATRHLKCGRRDLQEKNIADLTGVDTVREIREVASLSPINGESRVWILDEMQGMTRIAQNAFLKLLEEPPKFAYFMLCTTDPGKLIKAIRSRCVKLNLKPLSHGAVGDLIEKVSRKEGITLDDESQAKLIDNAEGSARDALKMLEAVRGLKADEDKLAAIGSASAEGDAIELARVLANPRSRWPDVKVVLNKLREHEPEAIRRVVLGYFTSIILGNGTPSTCIPVYESFRDEFHQSGKAGFSQLVFACAEVISGRR